jgi:hypothetical protein
MLKMLDTLLEDGVVIFEEDLNKIDALLKAYPDLITDIIKIHGLAQRNKDVVIAEHIYPLGHKKLAYELITYDVDNAVHLSIAIDKLQIRSKNLSVGIVYAQLEEEVVDEGD